MPQLISRRNAACFDDAAAAASFSIHEHDALSRHHFATKAQAHEVIIAWCYESYNTDVAQFSQVAGNRRVREDHGHATGDRFRTPQVFKASPGQSARRVNGMRWVRVIPVTSVVKRVWIPLLVVAVVVVVGFSVYRVRGIFGVGPRPPAVSAMSDNTKPFNPKQVTYEVFGVPGAVATVNYLDVDAQPQEIRNTTIPWSLSVTTTAPAVNVNVVAQSDEDFIGCRIIVNGVVKDERSISGVKAQTYCLVKSA